MIIKLISDNKKDDWERYIIENPYSIAWHSYEWSKVLKKKYGIDFYPLAAIDGSKIVGVLPLYKVQTFLGKKNLISIPYTVAGGILANSESISMALLKRAIDIYEEQQCNSITLKQYKIRIMGDLKTDENYYNRELELSDNIDLLWSSISSFNQQKIKESQKKITDLYHPSQDLDSFYKLLFKHSHNKGLPCVDKKWIKELIDFNMYSIALLREDNLIVAGTLIKKFKNTISFPFTCINDQSEQNLLFAYNLYWRLLIKFSAEGIKIFHSGRIPKNNKTELYRLGWGGKIYNYYYQYYPIKDEIKTESEKKRGRKRDILSSIWKNIPPEISKFMGPYIIRHLP
jgi:hypothetical protein